MKTALIVIANDADHQEAIAFLEALIASDTGSPAQLKAQATLIEAYERERWPARRPSMADMLDYLMDQHDLRQVP